MEVLGDIVGRDRRSNDEALRVPAAGRSYDYRRFCTSAWKTGNLLRHYGVRRGDDVLVTADPDPEPLLALFGVALLGGVVQVGRPPTDDDRSVEGDGRSYRVVVGRTADLDAHGEGASTTRVAYGGPPDESTVAHFEREVWSENPTEPPDAVGADHPAVRAGRQTFSHADLLAAAGRVVESRGLDADSTVAVGASLADPGVLAGGVLAPLRAGGTVVLGSERASDDGDVDVVVGGPDGDVEVASLLDGE